MKKNYNIHLNPKRLSKEEIERHKDFDALLAKYRSAPKPRQPIIRRLAIIGAALAVAASVAILLFAYFGNNGNYEARDKAHFAALNYINPPIPQVKPSFASFQVNATKGGIYEYPSGSKLIVPAAAFSDQNGQAIEGEVVIRYREMHDFVDFFLSGIPMTYDSAGVKYTLESAGMIEIFAEQDGKKVRMAPGKSIDVELVSNVNTPPRMNVPPGYNIYKLDTEKRNWAYQVIDRMEVLEDGFLGEKLDENDPLFPAKKEFQEKLQAIQINKETELAKINAAHPLAKRPVRPAQADPNDYVFDLDFKDLKNPDATGELAAAQNELAEMYRQYEKMLWKLKPNSPVSTAQLQQRFSEVTGLSIRKLNSRDYELSLKKGNDALTIVVNPVLSGNDYENALADFNRDFDRWEKAKKERDAKLAAQKAALEKQLKEERRLAQLAFNEKIKELRANGLDYAATEEIIKKKVVNRFTATGFGIWNCDRPIPPEMMMLAANFKDENGKTLENKTAYLVDKSRNTVYQFLAENGARLRYNKNSDNLLWMVTGDNKIAVFRPEKFKAIAKETDEHTFVMQTIDKEIKDEKDVRDILYL
ncbi:MAG TPA: hypothetical protein ENJ95_15625 [Bacteroidetes bacterium]|nr:hypothetical protein [Bacteroidota bacterium]